MSIVSDGHRGGNVLRAAPARGTAASAYDALARECSMLVLRRYSTSFGLACRLLAEPTRSHVCAIYALVRVADEIVDAPRPHSFPAERRHVLDTFERELHDAFTCGHSGNLVIHAFVQAALACGIGEELTRPFFDSMRADVDPQPHDAESLRRYVYGSAEVVGLMCLRAFLTEDPCRQARYTELAPGARRLGAAFQKINFLRDLGEDAKVLGRRYFPDIEPSRLTDSQRDQLLYDIAVDLRIAAAAIPHLPDGSRRAVRMAHDLFAELVHRMRSTPAEQLVRHRIRVPTPVKARIALRCLARSHP